MNKEVFNKVLSNYKAIYDQINDYNGRDEIYKWPAVKTCIDNWNLEAPDFSEMLKKSMSKSLNIIENRFKHPINGLLFLCEHGKAEEVREEFRKLLSDDGDLIVRQKNLESFMDNINSMLNDIAPSKWSYIQDRRDAMMYLAFIKPADNYMFKASCAKLFSDYVEYGDDFGSGQSFRLEKYHILCDEVMAELEKDDEMKAMLDAELERRAVKEGIDINDLKSMPGKLRIVVYDIMYCADRCELYEGIARPVKKGSKEAKERNQKKHIEELKEKINQLDEQLSELSGAIPSNPDLIGISVSHIKFGAGTVAVQSDKYVFVNFDNFDDQKQFSLPDCIAKGFLKIENIDIIDTYKSVSENLKAQKKLSDELKKIATELSLLE